MVSNHELALPQPDGVAGCTFFFSSRRRHTRFDCDWSSDVCSSDLLARARQRSRRSRGCEWPPDGRRERERKPPLRSRAGRPGAPAGRPRPGCEAELRPRVEYTHVRVPKAVVCLPTYNERENLEPMLRALGDMDVRVLVIDDNSPDGTGDLADRLASELGYVDVLHRESKEGLGPAYLAGVRRALASDAELILEMDCDFSHDPEYVPRLIAAVEEGADLALGSRDVPRGGG